MTDSQNLEPRLAEVETDIEGIKISISDLRSTVATLADVAQLNYDHTMSLIQANREEAEADRAAIKERLDRAERQADADRALMLQLIQSIAQGRNGGNS